MAEPHGNGCPVPSTDVPGLVVEWLGRWNWRSTGPLPRGRRVAIVSSRLPRLIDPHGSWLSWMRAALARLSEPQTVALIAAGTAGSEFLLRGTERQQTPRIVIWCPVQPKGRVTVPIGPLQRGHLCDLGELRTDLWAESKSTTETTSGDRATPARDRVAIAWPDEIIVLALRAGGNVHTLLRNRLRHPNACVLLADDSKLQSRRARDELMGLGAKRWEFAKQWAVPADQSRPSANTKTEWDERMRATVHDIIPCPPAANWGYLTHWTRACPGPWPGQSTEGYVDSLLDCGSDADHSPLGSLSRIVRERRLVASSRAIRGGFHVVSFTGVALTELARLRVFRVHRARWDFEPYGICLRRQRLIELGVRSVIYSVDSDWNCLSNEDRPFFQQVRPSPSTNSASHQSAGIDWSVEREWRHVGDVDLTQLSREDAVLFVPSRAEARKLLEISPWPVTVLDALLR